MKTLEQYVKSLRNSIFMMLIFGMPNMIFSQTVLTTAGPVGGSLTTDDYGVVTNLTAGLGGNAIQWLEYSSSFVVLNGGVPLEVNQVNASEWDGAPAAPVASGYFIPNRFEDWSYDLASTQVWHNVLEYEAGQIHLIGSVGYKLIDPSGTLGSQYVDWYPAFQFTNVSEQSLTLKPFRYLRVKQGASTTTIYSNHDGSGLFTDYDLIDGTSDDYAVAYRTPLPFFMFSGFPLTHYRIQAYANPTLYATIAGGAADFDLTNSTLLVSPAQGEVGFQYSTITLNPNESVLYWLYPKPIKINNSADNYPTDIDWDTTLVKAANLNTDLIFTGTDVTINYSAMGFNNSTGSKATVVEITGGIITSAVDAPLNNVSTVRYWEIFYDTRRANSACAITFTYDPAFDGIADENTIELAYRSDYNQHWTQWADIARDPAQNTLTANNVNMGDAHWILASAGDNPLPVELAFFQAFREHNAVLLSWATESEFSNIGFIIERRILDIFVNENLFTEIASYKTHYELQGQGTSANRSTYQYIDKTVTAGAGYEYRLSDVSYSGNKQPLRTVTISLEQAIGSAVSERTRLHHAYPNPFNTATRIEFSVAEETSIDLRIVDITGRTIRLLTANQLFAAGNYNFVWNGLSDENTAVSSGIYFINLETDRMKKSHKLILLR